MSIQLSRKKLSADQIADKLAKVHQWRVENGVLTRTFDHYETYGFTAMHVATIAYIAEAMDHHPDIQFGYKKVTVSVSTHDAGGLTEYDFELARRIDVVS